MSDFNQALIDQIRANGGQVTEGYFVGRQVLILTTTGAKTGERRESPLAYTRDGDQLVDRRLQGRRPDPSGLVPQRRGQPAGDSRGRRRDVRGHALGRRRDERRRLYDQHADLHAELQRLRGPRRRVSSRSSSSSAEGGRRPRPDATLRGWLTTRSWSGPRRPRSSPTSGGDARGQPRRLGRGRRAIRGLVRRGRRAHPVRRDEPVRRRDASSSATSTAAAGGPIHLQCAGGRDTLSLWNQGADEVVGVDFSPRMLELAARLTRGDRRAGPLDPGRRARDAARARRHRPTSSTPVAARSSGSPTSTPGRRSSRGSCHRTAGSSCSRAIRPSGCSTPTPTATGSRPTTTTSAGPRRRRAGRPNTSTGCRSPTPTRAGSSPGPGRSARSSRRCSGADLRLEARGGVSGRLVGRPRRRAARGARPDPVVVLGGRRARDAELRPASSPGESAVRRAVGRADRDDRRRGRSARRCADRASPRRRTATGRRARRGPAVRPGTAAGRRRSSGRRSRRGRDAVGAVDEPLGRERRRGVRRRLGSAAAQTSPGTRWNVGRISRGGLVDRQPRLVERDLDDRRPVRRPAPPAARARSRRRARPGRRARRRPARSPRNRPVRARWRRRRRSRAAPATSGSSRSARCRSTTTTTRAPTRTAVSSSAIVIASPPSPTRATTGRSRWTSAAAIAAGRP